MNVYRKRVIDKIQKSILEVDEFKEVNADVIINEDYNSQNYGEIKKIYVFLKKGFHFIKLCVIIK
jgi:stage III sporulation protein AF